LLRDFGADQGNNRRAKTGAIPGAARLQSVDQDSLSPQGKKPAPGEDPAKTRAVGRRNLRAIIGWILSSVNKIVDILSQ
jgi:hypothetical protein